jgi:phosphoenolpyruvate synthase/pyruvate phosphate dikinase
MEKINFEKRWEAKHPIYRLEAVLRAYIDYSKIPACECRNMLMSIKNTITTTYFDKNEMTSAPKIGLMIIKNRKMVRIFIKKATEICNELVKISRSINKTDLLKTTNSDLIKLYNKYTKFFSGLFGYYNLSRPDYLINVEKEIRKTITEKESDIEKQKELFSKLTSSSKNSLLVFHEIEQLNFFNAILKSARHQPIKNIKTIINKDKSLQKTLQALIKKYAWISTQENNPPFSQNDYINKAKEFSPLGIKNIQQKITELKNKPKKLLLEKTKIIKKYNFSQYLLNLMESVADLTELRLNIRLWWTESSFYSRKLFGGLNNRLGFGDKKYGDFYYSEFFLKQEIKNLFSKKISIPESEKQVLNRIKQSLLLMRDKKIYLFIGDKADKIEKEYIVNEDFSQVKEIKGDIANTGFIRGKAWVISPSVINQVEKARIMPKGRILIAAMTRPQFIEGIIKSIAIVTDEGGITCHAAIVSRESRKPCVVGTKIATKVIKDGDFIEVDTNKGIIKIIRRAE